MMIALVLIPQKLIQLFISQHCNKKYNYIFTISKKKKKKKKNSRISTAASHVRYLRHSNRTTITTRVSKLLILVKRCVLCVVVDVEISV
jgi:hypothetical protein